MTRNDSAVGAAGGGPALRLVSVRRRYGVALVAALLAVPVSVLGGWGLLRMLSATHRVADGISYHFGTAAIGVGFGVTVAAGVLGAR
jgi:hypothetical protein